MSQLPLLLCVSLVWLTSTGILCQVQDGSYIALPFSRWFRFNEDLPATDVLDEFVSKRALTKAGMLSSVPRFGKRRMSKQKLLSSVPRFG